MPLTLSVIALAGIILLIAAYRLRNGIPPRAWRLLAFPAFGVLPVIFGFSAVNTSLHNMKEVRFCGGCHEMDYYVNSLTYDDDEPLASVHYRNNYVKQETACYQCHTGYAMFGEVKAKMNGLRHVWVSLTKSTPEQIELYEPYSNSNCLHCHGPAQRFQEQPKHQEEENFIARCESGELSCLKSGCHDEGHYWEEESDDDEEW